MLFATTAFRPDRPPEMTQLLNDMSWIVLVMPWPPFMAQNFSFSFAILCDKRERPLFPRYVAYVNIWAPIVFTPALALPFFKTGPLAWNGIFVIWIPAFVFVAQFIVNTTALLKAIQDEEAHSSVDPGPGSSTCLYDLVVEMHVVPNNACSRPGAGQDTVRAGVPTVCRLGAGRVRPIDLLRR
jgi:hypothetical protein